MLVRRLWVGSSSVILVLLGCGGSKSGGSSGPLQFQVSQTASSSSVINGSIEVDNDGTYRSVSTGIDSTGSVLSITADINGTTVALALPPSGAQSNVILSGGMEGTYYWNLYETSGGPAGSIVWNLSNPKAAPVQIAGFRATAIRPDGLMAVGLDVTSGKVEYCSATGQISAFTPSSAVASFFPSCINMKNQVAGLGSPTSDPGLIARALAANSSPSKATSRTSSNATACYICDGAGNATLLQGSQSTGVLNSNQFSVQAINDNGATVGYSSTPGNAVAAYWSASGQETVLPLPSAGAAVLPSFLTDSNDIFGFGTQTFPSTNPALLWTSPTQAPVAISSVTSGQQVPSFIGVLAVSPNGRNVVASDSAGNLYVLKG